jgi:tRNA U34 5-carboxymethylaminomethyl modifying enzyme MnmG/GidA
LQGADLERSVKLYSATQEELSFSWSVLQISPLKMQTRSAEFRLLIKTEEISERLDEILSKFPLQPDQDWGRSLQHAAKRCASCDRAIEVSVTTIGEHTRSGNAV